MNARHRLRRSACAGFAIVVAHGAVAQEPRFDTEAFDYTTAVNFDAAITGDIDADGRTDLILRQAFGYGYWVYRGAVIGGFEAPVQHFPGVSGTEIPLAVDDIDDDGFPDVVAAGTAIKFYRGAPGGVLLPGVSAGTMPHGITKDVEYADLDGDGREDILHGGVIAAKGVTIVLRGATGFQSPKPTTLPGEVVSFETGDWDADGDLDLAIVTTLYEQKLRIALGDGVGNLTAAYAVDLPVSGGALSVADLNEDGFADVALPLTSMNATRVYFGAATGFGPSFSVPTLHEPRSAFLSDFTGDGSVDLAVGFDWWDGGEVIELRRGNGAGALAAAERISVGSSTTNQVAARVDSDAAIDIVVTSSLALVSGDGAGGFGGRIFDDGTIPMVHRQFAFDWTGDGRDDVLQLSSDIETQTVGGHAFRAGLPGGAFGPVIEHSLALAPTGDAAMADLNGDGAMDVVSTRPLDNRYTVLRSLGGASFAATTQPPVSPFFFEWVELADVTGDGAVDLLGTGGSAFSVGIGDGTGGFGPQSIQPNQAVADLRAGDFDLDGDLDLAIAAGGFTILENTGGGSFVARPTQFAGSNGGILAVDGDLDGRLDLLRNALDTASYLDVVAFYRNLGSWSFTETQTASVYSDAQAPIAADFDFDGAPEFVFGAGGFDASNGAIIFGLDANGTLEMRRRVIGPPGGWPLAIDVDSDLRRDLVLSAPRGLYVLRQRPTSSCPGQSQIGGTPCIGTGGFAPWLSVGGCPVGGDTVVIALEQVLGGAAVRMIAAPATGGLSSGACAYSLNSVATFVSSFVLEGIGAGSGSLVLPVELPASVSGFVVDLQFAVADPASANGIAWTHAIRISIG